MSILIKALKQAERDHHARTTIATPPYSASSAGTAVLEPEPVISAAPASMPAVRNGEALSLTPVDQNEHAGTAQQQSHRPESRDGAAATMAAQTAAQTAVPSATEYLLDAAVAHEDDTGDADLPAPAERPAPRVVATVLQTNGQDALARRAPGTTPRPPVSEAAAPPPARAPAEPKARATADAAPEQTLAPDDLQVEQRKAARQLMAAAPAGRRYRRLAVLLFTAALFAGAIAGAYWQGLFTGLDGLLPGTPPPIDAGRRTLAERLPQAPAAPKDKTTQRATHGNATAAPASGGAANATSASGNNDAGNAFFGGRLKPANAHSGFAAGNAAAVEAARASDAIHLRPPEATPERLRALLQEAYTAAGRGDTSAAGRTYQQVIDLDHNNGDAWIGLAALAANNGDSATANHDYRRALEIDPGDSVALGGLLGMQSGVDPQEAESRLRLLLVRDGAQPALQAALGKMLARQGRWLEAQETFYQAWTADPSQPDVAFNLAVSLERIRQPVPALSFYRRALELAQNHSARFDPAVAQERVTALTPKQP
jgi:tetratricopeptide (TPR) repeat protein